jgi:hypothetical protein
MTVIEIRPHRLGLKVLNLAPSSLYFCRRARQSITRRAAPASAEGEIRILSLTAIWNARLRSVRRIEALKMP